MYLDAFHMLEPVAMLDSCPVNLNFVPGVFCGRV
jgi:hypothetical protein